MAKVLVIDDDLDLVEVIRTVLESKGYKVASAESGKEGLQKMKEERPDLIILDVMMTTKDEGFNVSRDIKKNPECKDIPILMLTALKEKTGFDFAPEAGDETWLPVEDYVNKPIQPDELLSKVEKLIKGN